MNYFMPSPQLVSVRAYFSSEQVLFGIVDTACVFRIPNGLLLVSVGGTACFIGSFKMNL